MNVTETELAARRANWGFVPPRLDLVITWMLILLAGALYFMPSGHSDAGAMAHPGFAVPAAVPTPSAPPVFKNDTLNPDTTLAMSHVASICELPDSSLAAAWYSGSREGARDVAIYFATKGPGEASWSAPRPIVTMESATRDVNRRLKKVGNAVLFSDEAGKLGLLYVTITMGGWSASSLQYSWSEDQGRSWRPGRHLTLSPFFNLSELVRNRPVPLADGSWAVPIYHELVGKFSEVLWIPRLGTGGEPFKTRINGGRSGFQPSLVPLSTNAAITLMRDPSPQKRISLARSEDAGRSWSTLELLNLPNPDSGLTALRLRDGRCLLIFNDSLKERDNLRLAVSSDEGRTWTRIATLDQEPGAGVSYPYAIQTKDGQIHVVYTWKRMRIKHLEFNPAWVTACQAKSSK